MVVQGHDSTLPVTLDEMIYHAELVGRAVERALVIVDLPFPINHLAERQTIDAGARILKEARCQAIKLEGGAHQAPLIAALVAAGIPVMAHVGLRPQSVHLMGGYRIQRDQAQLLDDAIAAEQAGAFAIVLECIPKNVAQEITARISIPTIGIGAGPHCDGQVLVTHDLIGLTTGYVPSFVKQYADVREHISAAMQNWQRDVRDGSFPDEAHSFK
jgi:3-methyl-2-oxobutanoate hydroxymethyltransferase